jgi:CheY-like chemotaxis protein
VDERVLLVEDDASIRATTALGLEAAGFRGVRGRGVRGRVLPSRTARHGAAQSEFDDGTLGYLSVTIAADRPSMDERVLLVEDEPPSGRRPPSASKPQGSK